MKGKLILIILAITICGCVQGCVDATPEVPPPAYDGNLTAYYMSVGQGDAELIIAGNETVLVDAGPEAAGPTVVDFCKRHGVTRIDYLVITHPHEDHDGGAEYVLRNLPVEAVVDNGAEDDYYPVLTEKGIPRKTARLGDRIGSMTFLWPDNTAYKNTNDDSLVFTVCKGDQVFLFTGDATSLAERGMQGYGVSLDCDVLKVGHHGSGGSTSASFLAVATPDIAIIMVGDNTYGHPDEDTLARLDCPVYRTDRDGNVTVTTDGSTLYAVDEA